MKNYLKINVHYKYNPEFFFPKEWLEEPINAIGEEIKPDQILRIDNLLEKFYSFFPKKLLEKNLKNIYFLHYMKFYNIDGWGGTRSEDSIYIILRKEYEDIDVLEIMIEEFSSILMMNYDFDYDLWNLFNFSDFKYSGTGVEVLNNNNLLNSNEDLYAYGFLYKYAMSSIENDFNSISRYLFLKKDELLKLAGQYPIIKNKMNYAIDFYRKLGVKI